MTKFLLSAKEIITVLEEVLPLDNNEDAYVESDNELDLGLDEITKSAESYNNFDAVLEANIQKAFVADIAAEDNLSDN